MYGKYDASTGPKLLMVAMHVFAVVGAAWLLFGGINALAATVYLHLQEAEWLRRFLLITLSVIYFFRLLATLFVMQKRQVEFYEAAIVGTWVIIIHLAMAVLGGSNPIPVSMLTWVGVALYCFGSYLNSGSEYQRMRWKRAPGHKGLLYTQGLFRYAMHINYFGDAVLFSGFAMVTGTVWAFVIPAIMVCLFLFVNIPMLDKYLAEHYGPSFTAYASRTAKFVPFVY